MGKAPNWRTPRHLAVARRSGADAREPVAAEWALAAVAIVLTAAVLIGQMLGDRGLGPPEPGPRDGPAASGPRATRPPAAAPSTAPGPSAFRHYDAHSPQPAERDSVIPQSGK
jgi:hypothetical protein